MKKILSALLIFALGFGFIGANSVTFAVGITAQKMASYQRAAEEKVNEYVTKYRRLGYSDEKIVDLLLDLQESYERRTLKSTYRGVTKAKIDAILIALENTISSLGDGDVYSEFNTTVTPTYAIPKNALSLLSTVSVPNQSIDTSVSRSDGTNIYSAYDVYIITPSRTGSPQLSTFTSNKVGQQSNSYQSYTVKTTLYGEYKTTKVKSIRNDIAKYVPTPWYTGQVPNGPSLKSNYRIANSTLETYYVYIAQDNSEAIFIQQNQTGTITPTTTSLSGITLDTASITTSARSSGVNYKNLVYQNYQVFIYTPPPGTSPLNFSSYNITQDARASYAVSSGSYDIYGYKVASDKIMSLWSYAEGLNRYSSAQTKDQLMTSYWYSFYPKTDPYFTQGKLNDGTNRFYRIVIDNSGIGEAYITEYIQYSAAGNI